MIHQQLKPEPELQNMYAYLLILYEVALKPQYIIFHYTLFVQSIIFTHLFFLYIIMP